MANNKSSKGRSRSKLKRELLYFYLDDKLYKTLWVSRPANIAVCWRYEDEKQVQFPWSDLQRRAQPSFTTAQVAKLIGRHRMRIYKHLYAGAMPFPQKSFPLEGERGDGIFRWSEKDIMTLHDYFLTVHRGRPRNDGRVTPAPMPSKPELRAALRNEQTYYVKDEDGKMIPVWKAVDW